MASPRTPPTSRRWGTTTCPVIWKGVSRRKRWRSTSTAPISTARCIARSRWSTGCAARLTRTRIFALITSVEDIRRVKQQGITGGFLTFEGFEPLESDLKLLDVFYDLGLRMASLTHSRRNFFADGTQMGVKTGGLSKPGQDAVRRMNELGIVIDLAHLNQAGCWEVLERSEAPVVLSHTSPRKYFPENARESPLYPDIVDDRSRALLDAIAANGGVVGIIAYNQPDLDAFVDDVEYVIRAVGADHVALGTDFFGIERAPLGFQTMAELPNLTAKLVERGHSDEVIRKVLGENYLRVFSKVWA